MRSIAGVFGRSPFRPLAQHTEKVNDTVQLVRPLMEAFLAGDWAKTDELYVRISKLEHKADVLKSEIRDRLPKSLFLPVDRGEALEPGHFRFRDRGGGIASFVKRTSRGGDRRGHNRPPAHLRAQDLPILDGYLLETSLFSITCKRRAGRQKNRGDFCRPQKAPNGPAFRFLRPRRRPYPGGDTCVTTTPM